MYEFELLHPETVADAVALKREHESDSVFIAGGTNLLYLMKRGVRKPKYLINLKGIEGLRSISYDRNEGLSIGALVRIAELQRADATLRYFPILSACASKIASPQIRNAATVGGNLSQEVWCWYLDEGFDCWMNGGRHCYAPGGDNRYHHSVLGGFICLAVHPSDLATAFLALNSKVSVAGPSVERQIGMDDLLPGFTKVEGKLKQNALKNSEIVTKVSVPLMRTGSRSIFRKYASREAIDFALSSIAIILNMDGATCERASVVLGGIATKPYRASKVEEALQGNKLTESVIERVSNLPFEREIPLTMNAYRIKLTKELLRSTLLELAAQDQAVPFGKI